MDIKAKMNCTFYWLLWIFIVIFIIQLKYFAFNGAGINIVFLLFILYSIPTWIMIGVLSWIKCKPAISYLEENEYTDLRKSSRINLRHIPDIPNKYRRMRVDRFLMSRYNAGDHSIKRLKEECRWYIILKWTLFISYPVVFLILLYTP